MKKMTFLACAAMLTSAVFFTGCKKDQNAPEKQTPKVTTDIAISLPGQVGNNGARKMPGTTVQTRGADDFADNGMQNIILIPFAEKAAATSASKRHGANIALGSFSGDQAINADKGRSKVFTNQQVPMGTASFLFYGKSGANNANRFSSGYLAESTLTGEPSTFVFALQSTCSNAAQALTDAGTFNAYLNSVANAFDTLYNKTKWKDITSVQNEGYYNMFQTYKSLTTLSTYGVERMMTDLYNTLSLNTDSLAKAIRKAIINPTYASLDNGKVVLVSGLQNYPQKYNIPAGAVSTAFSEGAFGGSGAHAYGDLTPGELAKYVYPAELWYFANTKIKTANASKASAYTSATYWKDVLEAYGAGEGSVDANTKSIALIDTIQYAVARLDVNVKIAAGSIYDNNPVEGSPAIEIPAGGYTLTAVLVGGQRNVGFDFTPLGTSEVYTIYDTIITPAIAAQQDAGSSYNSTLVLETAEDDGNNGSDIPVALEFINKGGDFYGVGNQLIPAGARFYIVGKLEASVASQTDNKVFKQDYTTTARFNITTLKKAYSTIPDLKAPQLEIGMSVDLTWQAGHTYDVNIN